MAVCDECGSVYTAYRDEAGDLYLKGAGERCHECGATALCEVPADAVEDDAAGDGPDADGARDGDGDDRCAGG